MESDGYKKDFPKETASKLRTKRQVRICPAKGIQAELAAHAKARRQHCWFRVKHKRWEERCRTHRPGYVGRWACQGSLPGLGDLQGSLPALRANSVVFWEPRSSSFPDSPCPNTVKSLSPLQGTRGVPTILRGSSSSLFLFPSGVTEQWLKQGAGLYLSFVSKKRKHPGLTYTVNHLTNPPFPTQPLT